MSEVSLRIGIAGGEYPLRIKEEDAGNVQRAADLIKEKIAEFEKSYSVKEKKDILAMVLLQLVTQFIQQDQAKSEEIQQLKGILDELNEMVRLHQQKINQ